MSQAVSKIKGLQDKLPSVDKCMAIILLLINIFFPGVGTMICACIKGGFVMENLVVGLIQFLTACCIIGWIWSIWWGVVIIQKSSG
jgi:hypothetical protein